MKNIKHIGLFVILSVILLVIIAFFVVSYTHVYDEPIPWPGHGADEILVEIRNSEMTLQEALSNNDIGTWVNHGSYVSYDGGDVGIGIIPEEKLHVAGRIKAEGFCVGEDCYDMMPMDHAYKPIPSCNEDEVVKWNGTGWECKVIKTVGFCVLSRGYCDSVSPGECKDTGCSCQEGYKLFFIGQDSDTTSSSSYRPPTSESYNRAGDLGTHDAVTTTIVSSNILTKSYICIKESEETYNINTNVLYSESTRDVDYDVHERDD